MFGYLDESGAPGKAVKLNDYYIVSLVIFADKTARDTAIEAIEDLRKQLHLAEDYEFHCSRNATKVQNAFIDLMPRLDFSFVTVAMKKDNNAKTVTNARMAEILIEKIGDNFSELRIDMDVNHVLYQNIRKVARKRGFNKIRVRECRSKNHRLIQVADYVSNISYKHIKNPIKTKQWFDAINKKKIEFVKFPE